MKINKKFIENNNLILKSIKERPAIDFIKPDMNISFSFLGNPSFYLNINWDSYRISVNRSLYGGDSCPNSPIWVDIKSIERELKSKLEQAYKNPRFGSIDYKYCIGTIKKNFGGILSNAS